MRTSVACLFAVVLFNAVPAHAILFAIDDTSFSSSILVASGLVALLGLRLRN